MEVNEEEINQILGAMFTNSIDIGNIFQIYISKILGGIPKIERKYNIVLIFYFFSKFLIAR